jgi:hypothetical protein
VTFDLTVFFQRFQVINRHRATLAFAQRIAGMHPAAGALVAVAGFVQHFSNGLGGDVGQRFLAQRLPQGHQRLGRRLILVSIRLPLHFGQDARSRRAGVGDFATLSSGNPEGLPPFEPHSSWAVGYSLAR